MIHIMVSVPLVSHIAIVHLIEELLIFITLHVSLRIDCVRITPIANLLQQILLFLSSSEVEGQLFALQRVVKFLLVWHLAHDLV